MQHMQTSQQHSDLSMGFCTAENFTAHKDICMNRLKGVLECELDKTKHHSDNEIQPSIFN